VRLSPRSPVRRHALRVAGLATLLVALGLAAVLAATDLLVSHSLTAAVDQRLTDWLGEAGAAGSPLPAGGGDLDNDFDEPVVSWLAVSGAGCKAQVSAPALPASLCRTGGPSTVTLAGVQFRLSAVRLSNGDLVVAAESLAPVAREIGDMVVAELIVGPVLLVLVFLGALAVGSRVGGSVERMRQRQLAFTADASHELRTPLSVLQAETDLARGGDARSLRPALLRVRSEIGRMRRLVDDLLWLARFDSEPAPPPTAVCDLATMARTQASRFTAVAAARSVGLTADAPDGVVPVAIPPEWLERLSGVLLDNACRHAASRISISARQLAGHRVELAVADDGEGIPPDELPRIFDRFHRATSRGEGAGLGLAIADAVVRASGGRWEVSARPEGGVRFAVVWPLPRNAAASEPGAAGSATRRALRHLTHHDAGTTTR
jgi:signal transduction histidine kinase